jgi:ketosteroid isomerase-like protein
MVNHLAIVKRRSAMILKISFASLVSFFLGAVLFSASSNSAANDPGFVSRNSRAADAAAIRSHIESIFQAFIDGDVQKIYATHSEDWRGFLEGSRVPIKGIDEYMRANGFDWPRPEKAPKPVSYFPSGTGYAVNNFDVQFYSPELAVASFIGDFTRKEGDTTITLRRFRIMDVYAKRKGSWIQVASHTVIDPAWRQERMAQPMTVSPDMREQILNSREAVWKAWFTNDRAALERMIPAEAIAIDDASETWSNRTNILAGAQRFADNGGKLVRLEFPKTELQVYGNTIIVYTTYLYETEVNGQRTTRSGRGTEIFVRRGDELVNTGWQLDSKK